MFQYKNEKYLLPGLIIIFIFIYHYFNFYQQDFKTYKNIINPNFSLNEYDKIQQYQPYYIIYKYALEYEKKPNNKIIYIFLKTNEQNFDYTSTVYAKKNTSEENSTKVYLSELSIMNNYFFYPRTINPLSSLSLKELALRNPKSGDLIVSDAELGKEYIVNFNLERIHFEKEKKEIVRINRKREENYYLYLVK